MPEDDQLRNFTLSREMVYNVFRQFLYDQEPNDSGPTYIDRLSLTMFWRQCSQVFTNRLGNQSILFFLAIEARHCASYSNVASGSRRFVRLTVWPLPWVCRNLACNVLLPQEATQPQSHKLKLCLWVCGKVIRRIWFRVSNGIVELTRERRQKICTLRLYNCIPFIIMYYCALFNCNYSLLEYRYTFQCCNFSYQFPDFLCIFVHKKNTRSDFGVFIFYISVPLVSLTGHDLQTKLRVKNICLESG